MFRRGIPLGGFRVLQEIASIHTLGHVGNAGVGGRVHARLSISVREIMFDVLMNLMAILSFLSFGFSAVPWFVGARWGRRGIWLSTGCVVVILCLFPLLFSAACDATNCGQGAIAIFVLGPIWIGSGLLTLISAAFAHYKFVR